MLKEKIFIDITVVQFKFCGAFTEDVYVGKSFGFYEELEDVNFYNNYDITQDERLWKDYQISTGYLSRE